MAPLSERRRTRIGRLEESAGVASPADEDALAVLADALRARCHDALARDSSHELKDALNAIVLNGELLGELSSAPNQQDARLRCLEVIRAETRRVDRIATELCRPVIPTVGHDHAASLSAILESVAKLAGPRSHRLGVMLVLEAADNPTIDQAAIVALHTALLATTLHALAASTRGGRVRISAEAGPTHLRLSVDHAARAPDCPPHDQRGVVHQPRSWARLVHDVLAATGGALRAVHVEEQDSEPGCRLDLEMPLA